MQNDEKTSHEVNEKRVFTLASLPNEVANELKCLDLDGSGEVNIAELRAAAGLFEKEKTREKIYKRIAIASAVVMMFFILVFFGIVIAAIQVAKESVFKGSVMTVKGTDNVVQTASSDFYVAADGSLKSRRAGAAPLSIGTGSTRALLTSEYPDEAFTELVAIEILSNKGKLAHLNVLGFMREADSSVKCPGCSLPDITLWTHVGRVTLRGDALYYHDDVQFAGGYRFFADNGFLDGDSAFGDRFPKGRQLQHSNGARRLQIRALYALFNAVVELSKLGAIYINGTAFDPPYLPENFRMVAVRRTPCVPLPWNGTGSPPESPPFNVSVGLLQYRGYDVCKALGVPENDLINGTGPKGDQVFYLPMTITTIRFGKQYLRVEYEHPMYPNSAYIQVLDVTNIESPVQFEYQVDGPGRGYATVNGKIANEAWASVGKNWLVPDTGVALMINSDVAYFNELNYSRSELESDAVQANAFEYYGNTTLEGERVRIWAFDILGGLTKATWYDTWDAPHTVRRLSFGPWGDLDVFSVTELPEDFNITNRHLFDRPYEGIANYIDSPNYATGFTTLKNSTEDDSNVTFTNSTPPSGTPPVLPGRVTVAPWFPYEQAYMSLTPGEAAARRMANEEEREDRERRVKAAVAEGPDSAAAKELAADDAAVAHGRSRQLVNAGACTALNKCGINSSPDPECRKKPSPETCGTALTRNALIVNTPWFSSAIGPYPGQPNEPYCMFMYGLSVEIPALPILSISGQIQIQLGKDLTCYDQFSGTISFTADLLFGLVPEALAGYNPFVWTILQATVGVYSGVQAGLTYPACTTKTTSPYFQTSDARSAALFSNLGELVTDGVASQSHIASFCACTRDPNQGFFVGGVTLQLVEVPGVALYGIGIVVPFLSPVLTLLLPALAGLKFVGTVSWFWTPNACKLAGQNVRRRDVVFTFSLVVNFGLVQDSYAVFQQIKTAYKYDKANADKAYYLGEYKEISDSGQALLRSLEKTWDAIKNFFGEAWEAVKDWFKNDVGPFLQKAAAEVKDFFLTLTKPVTVKACRGGWTWVDPKTCKSYFPTITTCIKPIVCDPIYYVDITCNPVRCGKSNCGKIGCCGGDCSGGYFTGGACRISDIPSCTTSAQVCALWELPYRTCASFGQKCILNCKGQEWY